MIKFFCIHCGTKIAAEDEWQGLESVCPSCQQKVQVPVTTMTDPRRAEVELSGAVTARANPNHTQNEHAFRCSECRLMIYSSKEEIGILVECPHCSATIMASLAVNEANVPVAKSAKRKVSHGAPTSTKYPVAIIVGVVAALALFLFQLGRGSSLLRESRVDQAPRDHSFHGAEDFYREASTSQGDCRARCETCSGTGQVSSSARASIIANHPDRLGLRLSSPELFCKTCSGAGTIRSPSGYVGMCASCGGTGASSTCGKCKGTGYR